MFQVIQLLVIVGLVKSTIALECSQPAIPATFQTSSSQYPGDAFDISSECSLLEDQMTFQCDYSVILGDGVREPSIQSSEYFQSFIAFRNRTYIDFDFTGEVSAISAIELSFFYSPADAFNLPDIELLTIRNGGLATLVQNVLRGNQDLTLNDSQVRTVAIQPLSPIEPPVTLRIRFTFTDYHNSEWLYLSEVRLCTDSQSAFQPMITFQPLQSSIVQPSGADLMRGSTELVCTVSNEGEYSWQWERDNSMVIGNADPKYDILIGDGSRTTRLMISNLDFSNAGRYECKATLRIFIITGSLVFNIQYPEIVHTPGMEVVLPCDLHGYQSTLSPPVWLFMNGSEITSSEKYSITSGQGTTNTIVVENGTSFSSVLSNLTIRDFSTADIVDYTCRGPRGSETVIQLTVLEGTAPPTNSEGETCNTIIAVFSVLAVLLVVMTAATICLLVTVIILFRRIKSLSAALKCMEEPNPLTTENEVFSNLAYESETNSVDTEGYQTVPAETGTTLSKNKSYNKRHLWAASPLVHGRNAQSAEDNQQPQNYLVPLGRAPSAASESSYDYDYVPKRSKGREHPNQLRDCLMGGSGHIAASESSDQSDYDDVTVIPKCVASGKHPSQQQDCVTGGDSGVQAAASESSDQSDYDDITVISKRSVGLEHRSQQQDFATGGDGGVQAAASENSDQSDYDDVIPTAGTGHENQSDCFMGDGNFEQPTESENSDESEHSNVLVITNPPVVGSASDELVVEVTVV